MIKTNFEPCSANLVTILVLRVDLSGRLLFCNKEFESFFKINPKKFVGKKIEDLSLEVTKKKNGFILSSIQNGNILIQKGVLKRENLYFAKSFFSKGKKEFEMTHLAQKSEVDSEFLEILIVERKKSFLSKVETEKYFLPQIWQRNSLTRKALYSLSRKFESFIDSILLNSQSFLSDNLSILTNLTKEDKHFFNNILMESEKAKRVSRTICYLEEVSPKRKVQNLNDKISSTEEFSKLLLGKDIEITYALTDEIPYIDVREGIVEDFVFQIMLLTASLLTAHTKILIESGREKEKEIFKSYIQISVSRTNPEPQKIVELFKRNEARFVLDFNSDIFKEDGIFEVFSRKSSIVFKYILNSIEKPISLSEWRGTSLPLGHGTVLLLENENALRDAIRMTLERVGYNIHQAKTLSEAEKIVNRLDKRIDLLITDFILPDGNGYDFYKTIFSKQNVPVLIMSNLSKGELPHFNDIKNPLLDFLKKPFNRFELITMVKKMMGERN